MIFQGGYDHNFEVFANPCAILSDPESGRTMAVSTDCPGLQLYSGNFLEGETGKEGVSYLIINNASEATSVELPKDATVYTLTGRDGLRSSVMQLNGRDLVLGENDELPCLCGAEVKAGTIELPAESCSFIVL
jgi:hypothetical protein